MGINKKEGDSPVGVGHVFPPEVQPDADFGHDNTVQGTPYVQEGKTPSEIGDRALWQRRVVAVEESMSSNQLMDHVKRSATLLSRRIGIRKQKSRNTLFDNLKNLHQRLSGQEDKSETLAILSELHSHLLTTARTARNIVQIKALETGARQLEKMAIQCLKGETSPLSTEASTPSQLRDYLDSYEILAANDAGLDRSQIRQWQGILERGVQSQHREMQCRIDNLVEDLDDEVCAGIRAKTEERIAEGMAEMQAGLDRGEPLKPCEQCTKDLSRLPHTASEFGEVFYENQLNEGLGLEPAERLEIRKQLLSRYLEGLPVACQMKTMALLSQTLLNEIPDLVQMGVRQQFGDNFGAVRVGMDTMAVAMDREDDNVTMEFSICSRPSLLPFGALGQDALEYRDDSSISGTIKVTIDANGQHIIHPPVVTMNLTGVV